MTQTAQVSDADGDALGSLVFQKAFPKSPGIILMVIGTLLLAGAIASGKAGAAQDASIVSTIAVGAFGLLMMSPGIYLLAAEPRTYFHQRGMVSATRWSRRGARYEDVEELAYGMTRVFINGRYQHTQQVMQLNAAKWSKPLRFTHVFTEKADFDASYRAYNEVEDVRNTVAAMIAIRMKDKLQAGEAVPWTPQMRLRTTCLEIIEKQGHVRSVPFSDVAKVDFNDGVFSLWITGEAQPAVNVKVDEVNFFPGYRILAENVRGKTLDF